MANSHLKYTTKTAVLALFVWAGAVLAQGPANAPENQPPPMVARPVLTEVQKLQLQNCAQRYEIATLRLEQARGELGAMLRSLQVEGYTLDLQTLAYVATPPEKNSPQKK